VRLWVDSDSQASRCSWTRGETKSIDYALGHGHCEILGSFITRVQVLEVSDFEDEVPGWLAAVRC